MKLLVTALEKSANMHFARILEHLDNVDLYGIYDKNIHKNKPLYDFLEFNAMGFFEVLPLVLKAKKAIKELVLMAKDIDTIFMVDSPAFNIPFAKALRKSGYKGRIIYFILPQVWAWKSGRIKVVEGLCDELVSILPFEYKYFKTSKFFGSPLYHLIGLKKQSEDKTILYMPGSRKGEISRLMGEFKSLAKMIKQNDDSVKNVLVIPPFLKEQTYEIYGDISDFEICYDSKEALSKCHFAFICSGTATLEAGLIGAPFVLCYKAKTFDYFIAKMFVKIKYIGLCNIIFDNLDLGKFHDEFIQDMANKDELYKAYLNYNFDIFKSNSLKLQSLFDKDPSKQIAKLIKEEK